MNKIVIVSPYATVAPHFETELEIAQRHLDLGDQVTVISCQGELAACDFNPQRDPAVCRDCKLRRAHGLSRIRGRVRSLNFQSKGRSQSQCELPTIDSQTELKQVHHDNFDIGYAALSSLVSHCRDPEPDLRKHAQPLSRFLDAARQTYDAITQYLDRHRPNCVYVFNGRFASMRAVLRACQARNIECRIHERGCDTHHFQLHENCLPHEIPYMHRRMIEAWERADSATRHQQAAQWYQGRIKRVERNWHSFVKQQQDGRMPDDWDSNRHNVSIFTSSEDEFAAIGDCWQNQMYPCQASAIQQLADSLQKSSPQTYLTIRVHPNLAGVNNRSTNQLLDIDFENVRIIPPADSIDSYHLMRSSDTIATFGSSMGIEAVYWGIPSVLLGPTFYQSLGDIYRPTDHSETVDLLSKTLPPCDPGGALIYGYWQQTHGIRFKYFEPTGLFTGTFRGEIIYPRQRRNLSEKLARKWQRLKQRVSSGSGSQQPKSRKAA